jgi:hypothetical protein
VHDVCSILYDGRIIIYSPLSLLLHGEMPTSSSNGLVRVELAAIAAIGAVVASSLTTLLLVSALTKKLKRHDFVAGVTAEDELR